MKATKRRPTLPLPRSDEWVSAAPEPYIERLRALCEIERGHRWTGDEFRIAFTLGAEAGWDRHEDPQLLLYLRNHCRRWIERQLAAGKTVVDQMWQVYNLATRALEQITEQQRNAARALAREEATARFDAQEVAR